MDVKKKITAIINATNLENFLFTIHIPSCYHNKSCSKAASLNILLLGNLNIIKLIININYQISNIWAENFYA
ncbi:hypothetical protein CDQ83_02990 [Clostridium thermosuccinogenes]|nr:hypothetical protein CDQ83_02990 [Pseudoclostridium thermosuccinogenes]